MSKANPRHREDEYKPRTRRGKKTELKEEEFPPPFEREKKPKTCGHN